MVCVPPRILECETRLSKPSVRLVALFWKVVLFPHITVPQMSLSPSLAMIQGWEWALRPSTLCPWWLWVGAEVSSVDHRAVSTPCHSDEWAIGELPATELWGRPVGRRLEVGPAISLDILLWFNLEIVLLGDSWQMG